MAKLAGKSGYVKEGSNFISGIKSCSLDYTADVGDITDFEDAGHKAFLATLDGWAGSFEGDFEGQPLVVGTTYTIHIGISATKEYTGSVIITGVHPKVSVDGIVSISYDYQGTGVLTIPTI